MIPRYAPKEMAALFSDEARFAMWLRVELLATDGWVEVGDVPADAAEYCHAHAPEVDAAFVDAVAERERVEGHRVHDASRDARDRLADRSGLGADLPFLAVDHARNVGRDHRRHFRAAIPFEQLNSEFSRNASAVAIRSFSAPATANRKLANSSRVHLRM